MSYALTTCLLANLLFTSSAWGCIPTESPLDEFDFEYTFIPPVVTPPTSPATARPPSATTTVALVGTTSAASPTTTTATVSTTTTTPLSTTSTTSAAATTTTTGPTTSTTTGTSTLSGTTATTTTGLTTTTTTGTATTTTTSGTTTTTTTGTTTTTPTPTTTTVPTTTTSTTPTTTSTTSTTTTTTPAATTTVSYTTPTPAPGTCPSNPTGWTKYGANCYWVSPTARDRSNAKNDCANKGGTGATLVWISDPAEAQFVQYFAMLMGITMDYYIGLIHPTTTTAPPGYFDMSRYNWELFYPLVWWSWAPGQPSDAGLSTGRCAVVSWANAPAWDDVDCTTQRRYVCKAPVM